MWVIIELFGSRRFGRSVGRVSLKKVMNWLCNLVGGNTSFGNCQLRSYVACICLVFRVFVMYAEMVRCRCKKGPVVLFYYPVR